MTGGHGADAGAADRALVLMLLGTVLLVSPARLLWARGLLAVAVVFAVWAALIALAVLAARGDRGDLPSGDVARGERERERGDPAPGAGDRGPP
ncbi:MULTISPECIES: hypothetical protein [Sorangium]|uniref:Uncharacterized protein n=1 Tax=Sorangium cellulosum (strain So ce56) TaxID=448385 RepID=A9GAM5_SORC5|nr:hypothetical protein [Sorangium cellulosum]CAN92885.1 hypothetical protein predicted by Glimmer/Critica [Sorangium cellulosum So ce56]